MKLKEPKTTDHACENALRLLAEERDQAWAAYLAATTELDGERYEALEPWAWNQLKSRLTAVDARVSALRGPSKA